MPSAKSARVGDRKKERNQPLRTKARTFVTRTRRLIDSGDIEGAEGSARVAIAALDRAAQKGVIHENNASRRKSRLIKSLNKAKIGQE
ncbi:MAG: 30S ribosomal protein S20 [Chloroflexi bacterium]|mgnify:FL=1|nr:30S ribosomal protein S20 [Chloroflexota bacterium]MDP7626313.1 30S ribosomal protein S20 [SAR202 cluster bacterium]MQG02664.1 30S ribosomal protein S20 [SAR202 cluster bacterium]PKB64535.1 MAG: 30S ribosomal protein S20 [SAR202 cluster bacterium Io17-Chloro-G3]HAE32650.1 30S ribosomal protein S20 [Dehalococcoidia bacterium]